MGVSQCTLKCEIVCEIWYSIWCVYAMCTCIVCFLFCMYALTAAKTYVNCKLSLNNVLLHMQSDVVWCGVMWFNLMQRNIMWCMPFRTCIFSTYIRGASENNVRKNFELLLSLNLMSHDENYACDIMYYNITHAWRHVFLWCSMYVPQPLGKEIVNHHLSMPACSIINQELYSASVLLFYCVCEC